MLFAVTHSIENYVNYQGMAEDAVSAIEAGLKLKKPKQKGKRDLSPLSFDEFDTFPVKKPSKPSKAITSTTPFSKRISLLSGSATIQDDGIVYATSAFPSVRLGSIAVVSGCYYFEIHVVSEGLVQVGWCGKNQQCNEEEENGVGDDANSWSFGEDVNCDVTCRYGARQEMERRRGNRVRSGVPAWRHRWMHL